MADTAEKLEASERGIRNARKIDRRTTYARPRTVSGTFRKEQSLQARVEKRSQDRFHNQRGVSKIQESERENVKSNRQTLIPKSTVAISRKTLETAITGLSRWLGLGIVGMISLLQFTFASMSAVAFGLDMGLAGQEVSTVINAAGSTVNAVSNFFFGVDPGISLMSTGLVFWVMSVLCSTILFVGFWIQYYLVGVRPFGTVTTFLVSASAIALSLIPFLNIFPWMIGWVAYMNTHALFLRK